MSARMFLAAVAVAIALISLGAAPAVAAPSAAASAAAAAPSFAGPPTFVTDLLATLPTPVCAPSWGSIAIPICV